MTDKNDHNIPKPRPGPIGWLSGDLRAAIETTVSRCVGRRWSIRRETDLSEFACHRAAIVSDGSLAVFFKYGQETQASQQFEVELRGLQTLSQKTGVLVPEPLGIVPLPDGTLLILKALEVIERGPKQWRQIGSTLAQIHRVQGRYFGYERNGFMGPLHQDNSPESGWVTFFRERRLFPLLRISHESGNLPLSLVSRIEKLVARLPDLCGPEVTPTLLHGDAQQNNFISTAGGTCVIDPAIYYGHPEVDLALIDSWQPVPSIVLDSYRSEIPVDSGFEERRGLWRVPLYLAAVAIEGPMHLDRLTSALKRYE